MREGETVATRLTAVPAHQLNCYFPHPPFHLQMAPVAPSVEFLLHFFISHEAAVLCPPVYIIQAGGGVLAVAHITCATPSSVKRDSPVLPTRLLPAV